MMEEARREQLLRIVELSICLLDTLLRRPKPQPQLPQPLAIRNRRAIRTHMQFRLQIQGQEFGALRFDDWHVLPRDHILELSRLFIRNVLVVLRDVVHAIEESSDTGVTVKYMANFGPADSFTISSSQKTKRQQITSSVSALTEFISLE